MSSHLYNDGNWISTLMQSLCIRPIPTDSQCFANKTDRLMQSLSFCIVTQMVEWMYLQDFHLYMHRSIREKWFCVVSWPRYESIRRKKICEDVNKYFIVRTSDLAFSSAEKVNCQQSHQNDQTEMNRVVGINTINNRRADDDLALNLRWLT